MDKPYTGHSAEHQGLVTMVTTRVTTGQPGAILKMATEVVNGEAAPTTIYQDRQNRAYVKTDALSDVADHILGHAGMVTAVVERQKAAIAALGEDWVLDTAEAAEHIEQGA